MVALWSRGVNPSIIVKLNDVLGGRGGRITLAELLLVQDLASVPSDFLSGMHVHSEKQTKASTRDGAQPNLPESPHITFIHGCFTRGLWGYVPLVVRLKGVEVVQKGDGRLDELASRESESLGLFPIPGLPGFNVAVLEHGAWHRGL